MPIPHLVLAQASAAAKSMQPQTLPLAEYLGSGDKENPQVVEAGNQVAQAVKTLSGETAETLLAKRYHAVECSAYGGPEAPDPAAFKREAETYLLNIAKTTQGAQGASSREALFKAADVINDPNEQISARDTLKALFDASDANDKNSVTAEQRQAAMQGAAESLADMMVAKTQDAYQTALQTRNIPEAEKAACTATIPKSPRTR